MDKDQPLLPQIFIMGTIYMVLALVGRLTYAFGAERARHLLSNDSARRWMRWIAGGVMIAAAVWSAFALDRT